MMLPAGSGAIPASLWGRVERSFISSTENPQGLYRRPAIDFPPELPKVFCPQISLQSVYLMTPRNGVVEGEGAQIRLWPSGRPPGERRDKPACCRG